MKHIQIVTLAVIGIAACHTSTKSNKPAAVPPSSQTTPIGVLASKTWRYIPGEEELTAIHQFDSSATLAELTEGYTIYNEGACINCHQAKNIYTYSATAWKPIIDDMAKMAHISESAKKSVYTYILAIKAVQQK
jgi:hypothetical protein